MSSSKALAEFTPISLSVRGMDVRVYESRVVEGLSFVLVHGFGVSSRYFGPLAAELSKHGRVLVLDLPGFGDTHDPDKSPRITGFAHVVNATIRRLEVRDPIIVGHSMGAQVAVDALERAPGLARGALLAAPVVNDRERNAWLLLWRFMQSAVKEPPSSAWDSVVGFSRSNPSWLWRNYFPMLRYRIEDHLRRTGAPVVIVGGSEDRIAPPDWCHRLATVRDGVDVVIVEGEAHEMIHTAPVAVAHAAMALAGQPLPPGLPPCGD